MFNRALRRGMMAAIPFVQRSRRQFAFALALTIASIGAAAFAIILRGSLAFWYRHVFHAENVVEAISALPWFMRVLVPVLGGAAAGALAGLRSAGAQNVSSVMEAVALGNIRLSLRSTLSRVAASWTAIGSGFSIGREGPLIEFGGTLAAAVSRFAGMPVLHSRVLVAAGTAAGFAAAYNTPFAAILFVLETMVGIASPVAILPTMASAFLATALTRTVVGAGPIYGQRAFALQSTGELAWFAGLGVGSALVATAFKRVLRVMESRADRPALGAPLKAAIGGLVVGTIAVWLPQIAGNGYEPLNTILDRQVPVLLLVGLLAGKVAATSTSVASGVPGGLFTPTLLVGAAFGTLWCGALMALGWNVGQAGGYALVGMAAMTAATIHAPLTAAVLVFELSGDYPVVLPLLLATTLATTVSRLLGDESIYESELRRRGLGWRLTLEGRELTR